MSFNILSVELTPNPVETKKQYQIKVVIEECNYARLQKFTHNELKQFTHKQLANDKLNGPARRKTAELSEARPR